MNYTETQIQAAIDAAFPPGARLDNFNLDSNPSQRDWNLEAPNRLAIARAFLAKLGKLHSDAQENWNQYAEKSWSLPQPPAGHKWHRDDWTQDMLPEGWRPLVESERLEKGDEIWLKKEYGWHTSNSGSSEKRHNLHPLSRTRRPLPSWSKASEEPEKAKPADDPAWIPHDGGPCPLKDEEVEEWEWKMRDGCINASVGTHLPSERYWHHTGHAFEIIAYRVLKWKPGHGPQATKPKTFEAQGKTWFKHVPGDPMPCNGDRKVCLLRRDREEYADVAVNGKTWDWADPVIFGWRYADEQPEQETPEEAKAANLKAFNEFQDEIHATWENADAQPWQPAPGDVVRLKSGGPEMTVSAVQDSLATAYMFKDLDLVHATIPTACLEPAKKH